MAKRRVNLKFLAIIGASLAAAGVGVFGAHKFLMHENPKRYILLGDKAMRDQHYTEAIADYRMAAELSKNDHAAESDILVHLGDAIHEQFRFDFNLLDQDRQAYTRALTESPTNVNALAKLLARNVEAIEYFPKASAFTSLRDTAEKIKKLGSTDPDLLSKANAYVEIAPIAAWLHGIETADEEIDKHMQTLSELMAQDRTNPDVPYYLALGYINRAMEKRRQVKNAEANALFRNAVAVFNTATAADPENSILLVRYYQILQNANLKTQDETDKPDDLNYVPQMDQVLTKARALVDRREQAAEQARPNAKPGDKDLADPAIVDVYLYSADFANKHGKSADAEKMLRHLMDIRKDDQATRLALANLIHTSPDPQKLKEAVALLRKPITDPGLPGIGAYRSRDTLDSDTMLALTNYLIDQAQAAGDADERRARLAEVQESYEKLADKMKLNYLVLRLQGKIQLLTPGPQSAITAIMVLERARTLEDQQRGAEAKDWELTWLIARAYAQAQQTGRAKEYLYQLLDGAPNFVPARIMLARLLMSDNELDAAFKQIDQLKKDAPDLQEVKALELQYLSAVNPNDPGIEEGINKIIGPMAEGTKREFWAKVQALLVFRKLNEAVTMLESMRKQTPADIDIVQMLVKIYMAQGQKATAELIVKEALEKAPNDARLKVLSLGLQGATVEKIQAAQREAIGQTKEPLDREIEFFQFEQQLGNKDQAAAHLDAAEKIDPRSPRVLDLRFQVALQAQDWLLADAVLKRLIELNADEAHGLIYTFRLRMAKNDLDGAGATARQLVKDLPQFSQSHLCLGQQLQAVGQYDEAEKQFEIALQEQSQNLVATRGIIDCYYAMNLPHDAERYIDAGLKRNPGSQYFLEKKIVHLLNYGDPREAVPYRQKQLEANKKSVDAWLNLGAAYYQVAQVSLRPANPKEQQAKQALADAHKTFMDAAKLFPDERLIYAYLADVAVLAKDFPAGEQALKEFSARETKDHPEAAWVMLGDYYTKFGKFPEAEKALLTARDKSNNSPDAQLKLAGLYIQQGTLDKAVDALDPQSKDHRVQQTLAETLIQSKKLEAADKLLQRLIAENPKDAQFLATQAYVSINLNNIPAALAALNRAIDADPKNHSALYYRGSIALHQNPPDLDAAVKDLSASRDLFSKSVETHMALADALRARGETDDAAADLEKAVELLPASKDLRMKLIEVYAAESPPHWVQAEHSIREAEAIEAWKKDPDWRRVEASMWVVRTEYSRAEQSIQQALALSPPGNYPLIQDYLNILELGRQWRQLEDQCTSLLQNQQIVDEGWWVYRSRAVARRYMDQRDQALLDFDNALKIAAAHHNDDAAAMVIQSLKTTIGVGPALERVMRRVRDGDNHWAVIAAFLYLDNGDNANAVALIERVLAQPPERLSDRERDTAQNVAGTIYISAQEYGKAKDIFEAILQRNPDDLAANNNMACLLAEMINPPDPQKAKVYSEKSMALMQGHHLTEANIMDTHGWILTRCGQVDDGTQLIRQALNQRPIIEGYFHLGQLDMERNSPAAAVNQLRKAKELIVDHKAKHQSVDLALENRVEEAYQKALQAQPATAPSADGAPQTPKNQ